MARLQRYVCLQGTQSEGLIPLSSLYGQAFLVVLTTLCADCGSHLQYVQTMEEPNDFEHGNKPCPLNVANSLSQEWPVDFGDPTLME